MLLIYKHSELCQVLFMVLGAYSIGNVATRTALEEVEDVQTLAHQRISQAHVATVQDQGRNLDFIAADDHRVAGGRAVRPASRAVNLPAIDPLQRTFDAASEGYCVHVLLGCQPR